MGAITSRQNVGVEEVDISVNHAYRYPPKTGNYFSNHFIMGGERFDTAQPEMYLFGENTDLNFLGSRPAPFPYPAPSASEPSRTLKSLVNIRKESLRFVRISDDSLNLKEPEIRSSSSQFNIEFAFDCDVRCAITIMYFCTEEVTSSGLIYTPRDPSMNSETYHYKRGANQQFSQVCHVFDPSRYPEENLLYSFDREIMPIVIYCIAEEGEEPFQSHATIAVIEKHTDGYSLKPLKQKLFVDGLCYLLQEIYGIENKNTDSKIAADDDPDDNGAECVICMCDLRDTLILPCRHLCLCNCCADSLRYQANNCPICRAPFRALLQIKALQKTSTGAAGASANNEAGENVPSGYEAVSLIEALNGPSVAPQQPSAPPFQNMYVQLPQSATDGGLDGSLDDSDNAAREYAENFSCPKTPGLEDSTTQTDRPQSGAVPAASEIVAKGAATQMRMSVLMAQEPQEDATEVEDDEDLSSLPPSASVKKSKSKYSINEDPAIGARANEVASAKSNQANDGCVKRKSNYQCEPSIVQHPHPPPVSPCATFGIQETSLCSSNPADDDSEEMAETLSLLDELKSAEADDEVVKEGSFSLHGGVATPPTSAAKGGSDPNHNEAVAVVFSTLVNGGNTVGYAADLEDPRELSCSGLAAAAAVGGHSESQNSVVAKSSQGEEEDSDIGQQRLRETPKEKTSRKAKHKSNRSSGRKHRTNSSSGCIPPPAYTESFIAVDESSNPGSLAPESQSLPGTPLSYTSAVSRSSDASVSSASSTRALILSHPSQSSTVI